jgi:hypothetical protein
MSFLDHRIPYLANSITASSKISAPRAISSTFVNSSAQWLRPPWLGRKIIPAKFQHGLEGMGIEKGGVLDLYSGAFHSFKITHALSVLDLSKLSGGHSSAPGRTPEQAPSEATALFFCKNDQVNGQTMQKRSFPDGPGRLKSGHDPSSAVKTPTLGHTVQMGTHHDARTRALRTFQSPPQISSWSKGGLYPYPMELFNHIGERALVFLCKGESRYSLSGRRVEGIDGFEILLNALFPDSHGSVSECS